MRRWGCVQAGELLARHRGGLSKAERLRLEQHLEDCADCRFDAAALGDLASRVTSTPIEGVADAALRRALRDTGPAPEPSPRGASWGLIGLAVAGALIAALAFAIGSRAPDTALGKGPADDGALVATEATQIRVAHGRVRVPRGAQLTWEGSELVLGRAWVGVDVDPRPHRPFRVVTPRFTVEVTGTAFDVSLGGVRVHRGSVRIVAPDGQTLRERVGAGESWRLERAPRAAPSARAATVPDPDAVVASAPSDLPHRAASHERTAGSDRRAPGPSEGGSARIRFERAVRLEATDPDGAALAYRELESEGGAWAANALFARGQLTLARGHREEARRIFERYLRTSPDGLNAADARALLDETE